ncbi:MAG TPA: (4Fe-4S)-binding protein [Prolixibacteraceae bacterium]|nr:(4Fe-4S)-binding protein [Prolixibacteraceae bacterium]
MSTEEVKTYTNGEITIVWEPGKCTHSGMCVKTLPQVYNPQAKPWIKIENATTDQLKEQLSKCPSGALSYFQNEEKR